jgi:parallel beta-helix repeat protein
VHSFRNDLAIVGDVANGIGLSISTTLNYVASNVAYDCDTAFAGIPTQFIDSQANARGVDNIDTDLTTPDEIEIARDSVTASVVMVPSMSANTTSIQNIVYNRYACSYTPITAATTIATPGVYCLANTISNGDLSVTATGVTLCLNGRTIYNGTLSISGDRVHAYDGLIRGKTAGSGVRLTGDKCTLNDIRVSNCLTGFELTGADQNSLENCQALSCTREGYLLANATYNTLSGCQATSIIGTGTVAGIKTSGGIGNEIVDCTVNRVNSTATGDAYGIWGVTESRSQIHDNEINDVSAAAGKAKGLALDEDAWLKNSVSFEWTSSALSTDVRNVDWLSIRPGLSYVAIAESTPANRIRIFRFNEPDELNLCYELPFSGSMFVARWLRVHNISYLAVGGFDSVAGTDFKLYIFDEVSETLLPLPNATYIYDTLAAEFPRACAWLRLEDDRTFLAVGGTGQGAGSNIRILSFDGNYLSLVTQARTGDLDIRGLDWVTSGSRYFLAASSVTTNPALAVYEFDPTNNSLTSRATYNSVSGVATAVRWLSYKGDLFLGLTLGDGEDFRVLTYTLATNTLTYLVGEILDGYSESCDWMATGTSLYAVFSGVSPSPELNVYTFNPSSNTLTSFYQSSFSDVSSGLALRCFTGLQGRALIAVGFFKSGAAETRELTVLGFDLLGSTTSVVQNNTVSNISGTGIAVNGLSNPVLSNKVYNATTPYEPWKPFQLDPSNNNGIAYS